MKKLFLITSIVFILSIQLFSETDFFPEEWTPRLTGRLRNDFYVVQFSDEYSDNDILEARILLTKRHSKWRFYTDIRGYLYMGDISQYMDNEIKLLRSFIRIYSNHGDFTVGKSYVNFGIPVIFNVFELDKNINFTDLGYDKEGLLSITYDLPLGTMSGLRACISSDHEEQGGVSLFTNKNSFDLGWVYNRKGEDQNISGIYFKGDIEIGINAGYGFHFDDDLENVYHEASLGTDYSYKTLFFGTSFYYSEQGGINRFEYSSVPETDTYFLARFYNFSNIVWTRNEFMAMGVNNFNNLVDGSGAFILFFDYVLSNSFFLNVQTGFISGDEGDEYSSDTPGDYNILIRLEYKF